MRRLKAAALAGALVLSLFTQAGIAQVPQTLSFQGRLSDASNNPITAILQMTFRLYDAPTGGTVV